MNQNDGQNTNSIQLERAIFKKAIALSLFTASTLLILDLFFFKDYPSVQVEAVGTLICAGFVYFGQQERLIPKLITPFIIFMFLTINMGWYVGGGFNTGIALFYLLAMYVALSIINRKNRAVLIVSIAINLALLVGFEFNNPEIREDQVGSREELIGSYILITITFSLCYFLLIYVKNKFEDAREETFNMNQKLVRQSKELLDLNNELISMNENLESIVQEKTREIEEHNSKLLEFAVSNLEKVSKPVIKIKEIADQKELTDPDNYMRELKNTAQGLDSEVRELNMHLERDEL